MNKLPFFSWKFSNEPINFLTTLIPSQDELHQLNSYTTLKAINEDSNKDIHQEYSLDHHQWDTDIQWISNLEQMELIIKKYNGYIIPDANNYHIGSGPWGKIMIIGDFPSIEKNVMESFTGDIKLLLTKMLKYINVDIKDCYLTNLCYWIPHQQNLPSESLVPLMDMMIKHIQIINPQKILLLGNVVAQIMLNNNQPFKNLRGHVYQLLDIPTVVSWHPKVLDKFKYFRKQAAEDLELFKSIDN